MLKRSLFLMPMLWAAQATIITACQPPANTGADDHDHDDHDHSDHNHVAIQFRALVGEEAATCNKAFTGLGSDGASVSFTDFRFFVHDLRIVTDSGAELAVTLDDDDTWQHDGVALLDFEDKTGACTGNAELNDTVRGETAALGSARAVGLRFKLGVPAALNHADAATAPSPLNLTSLWWQWQSGYKFARIDAKVASAADRPFFVHLGSTGCTGEPQSGAVVSCARPNVGDVSLAAFDAETQVVAIDYAAIVSAAALNADDAGGAPGCMSGASDPECAGVLPALGVALESGAGNSSAAAFEALSK